MLARSEYRLYPSVISVAAPSSHDLSGDSSIEQSKHRCTDHAFHCDCSAEQRPGLSRTALEPEEIAQLGWNLLREDLSLPSAVLYQDRLLHNLNWMQQFIDAYGVKLAPHGKTTMAPRLFEMQLQAGAWGITLATAHQTLVAYRHGVRRVLMANQLIGKENMAIIARLLEDPDFEYYCLVDSAAQVEQLGAFYSQVGSASQRVARVGRHGRPHRHPQRGAVAGRAGRAFPLERFHRTLRRRDL